MNLKCEFDTGTEFLFQAENFNIDSMVYSGMHKTIEDSVGKLYDDFINDIVYSITEELYG